MKQNKLFKLWLLAVVMLAGSMGLSGQVNVNIIPVRTDVSGFTDWTDTNVGGTTYVQLLTATAQTITPAMNFDSYTNETLNFKARTYGGTNATENEVFVAISTDNGANWNDIGSRTPTTNSLSSVTPFDLSTYNGSQVKVKFYVKGTNNSIGVGVDDITFTGTSSTPTTSSPTFTPPAGTYTSVQSVELASTTTDAKIYYTTDGTEPTSASTLYTGAIPVNATTTIKAIAYDAEDANPSAVVSATYTFPPPSAPTATAATSVGTTGFTANWDAVSGATGYKLDVYTGSISELINTGFEGSTSFPTGWTQNSSYVNNNSSEAYSGTYYAGMNAANDYFYTPVLSSPGTITFWTRASSATANNTVKVQYSSDASTWTDLATYTANGSNTGDITDTYSQKTINANLTGNYYIRWFMSARSGGSAYFDDIVINGGIKTFVSGYENIDVSGTSQAVSGLASGTTYYYVVRATNANGTSENSNVITVYTGENYRSKTNGNWNDVGTWEVSSDNNTWVDASDVPDIGAANISIGNGHLITVTENASADLVTIQPTGKLTVNDGITLTVSEGKTIKLQSDETNGTATLVGNVGGKAIVEQAVESSCNYYVGVPIDGAVVPTGIGNKVATFTESTDLWTDYAAAGPLTSAVAGQGYLVQVPSTSQLISFSGTLNNGDKSATLSSSMRRFNFLGNPYPSYVDGGVLLNGLTVEQTLWYYSKEGTGYTFKTVNTSTNVSTDNVDKRIAPMQGFWVRANVGTTPTVSFKNTNRMHKPTDGNANIGFRAPQATDYQMLRLQVSNNTLKDVAIVMFSENSTSDWSSSKMMNPSLNVYTLVNGNELAINSNTAIPYDVETTVGLQAPAGEYTISATEFSNFSTDKVYLLDKVTGISTDLSSGGSYTVNLTADYKGTDRFALVFPRTGVSTGLESAAGTTFAFIRNNRVVVNSDALGSTVYVFNGVGQQVASQAITGATTEVSKTLSAGVYVVKVNNDTVKVVVK